MRARATARTGQSVVEYAWLLAVFIAALLAIQTYCQRALMGRLRASADSVGDQYAPKRTTSSMTLTTSSDTTTESNLLVNQDVSTDPSNLLKADVIRTTTTIHNEQTGRTGHETVGPLGANLRE